MERKAKKVGFRRQHFHANLSIPGLPGLWGKANIVDPDRTCDFIVQLLANGADEPHKQEVSIGEGREFCLLFRPIGCPDEVFR